MTAEGEGQGDDDSGEILLVEPDELLYRQVHPGFVDDGIPSAQAFAPTKKDEGKLSIARGKLTTAEGAYTHHTSALHLKSAGSWGLTVAETNGGELQAFGEPIAGSPAHGFIDFRDLGRGPAEKKAKLLLAHAKARGRLHP